MAKLALSQNNKVLAGVCGGIAEYFNTDSTIIRLIWALGSLMNVFVGVVAYIACVFIIPVDPGCIDVDYKEKK